MADGDPLATGDDEAGAVVAVAAADGAIDGVAEPHAATMRTMTKPRLTARQREAARPAGRDDMRGIVACGPQPSVERMVASGSCRFLNRMPSRP
jgi:hypothetical protein